MAQISLYLCPKSKKVAFKSKSQGSWGGWTDRGVSWHASYMAQKVFFPEKKAQNSEAEITFDKMRVTDTSGVSESDFLWKKTFIKITLANQKCRKSEILHTLEIPKNEILKNAQLQWDRKLVCSRNRMHFFSFFELDFYPSGVGGGGQNMASFFCIFDENARFQWDAKKVLFWHFSISISKAQAEWRFFSKSQRNFSYVLEG